ncbi:MAG TPA: hypothetical protein VE549_17680 [Myxococcaceae bacterium]|nr:hypothetical protein [Myxococcaceae bacterium]
MHALVNGAPANQDGSDALSPLGTGRIDYRAVLRAARDAGATLYYLEDESDRVLEQVPRSLAFLAQM